MFWSKKDQKEFDKIVNEFDELMEQAQEIVNYKERRAK